MAPRKDVHRPSALVVGDYDFIKFDYVPSSGDVLGDAMFLAEERKRFREHMERTGARYGENHTTGFGSCYICGAHAIYTATFHHRPSNSYICTGLECADHLDGGDAAAFKKKVSTALEAVAGKRKAKAVLEKAGYGAAWELYEADGAKRSAFKVECDAWRAANPEPKYISTDGGYGMDEVGAPKFKSWSENEYTVLDMVGKLIKYGSMSEKAMKFLGILLERIAKAPAIAAARAAEADAALPVPVSDKRITVKGKVLTVKPPAAFAPFPSYKMLVQHSDGWKVWGTVPSSVLDDIERGDEIEFVASIKVSDKDPKFGFIGRPSKAKLIKAKKEEEVA